MTCALLLSTGAVMGEASPARAEPRANEAARATELFRKGKAAFSAGNMAEAEQLFSDAFQLRKSSDIAANLGQTELLQQKFRAAAEHFAWAISNLMPSATEAQRKAVQLGFEKARAEVGELHLNIKPDGTTVLVGELPAVKSPLSAPLYVNAGEVIVVARQDGFVPAEQRLRIGKGAEQSVDIELSPVASAPVAEAPPPAVESAPPEPLPLPLAPPAAEPTHRSLAPALVATGVAVAGGVVGLAFTLRAHSKDSEADDLRDELALSGGCPGAESARCAELKDERESVDSARNVALGAFILGGVAAVTAGVLYWDALSSSSSSSSAGPAGPRLRAGEKPLGRGARLRPDVSFAPGAQGAVTDFRLGLTGTF